MPIPRKAKYVIIGAGIHGLSTAWKLAEKLKTGKDIVVIDKSGIASGASGIACGVIRNNYPTCYERTYDAQCKSLGK